MLILILQLPNLLLRLGFLGHVPRARESPRGCGATDSSELPVRGLAGWELDPVPASLALT